MALLTLALGCGDSTPGTPAPTASEAPPFDAAVDAPSADTASVSVQTIDPSDLAARIEAHHGQVVFVDFWATWCPPCREQFPHTVDMHRRLAERGLAVITVSVDEIASRDAVVQFLEAQEATCENLQSSDGFSEAALEAFAIDGSVPVYRVYNREGELAHTFTADPDAEPFGPNDLEMAVVALLDSPASD